MEIPYGRKNRHPINANRLRIPVYPSHLAGFTCLAKYIIYFQSDSGFST